MPNKDHLVVLKQGIQAWNGWRRQNRIPPPNLSGADLRGADLRGANLSNADLNVADLRSADLRSADLSDASLSSADLSDADLRSAHLSNANLSGANLSNADLSNADLSNAYLWNTDLSNADLTDARLLSANFNSANLSHTNLNSARIGWTIFDGIDLQYVKGLETIWHNAPSGITTSTLERSRGNIPEVFLRNVGVGEGFITYARSLVSKPIEYYTCFISYSRKDQAFAERLYNDLQGKGVRCWYAPKELKAGDFYRHKIDESIRMYDKLLLILSEHSIKSEWVEKEVQQAEEKEEQMDMSKQVLFPLRLDDVVMRTKREWVATRRFLRHIIDFTGWKDHDTYQRAFDRLLHDLKAEPTTRMKED